MPYHYFNSNFIYSFGNYVDFEIGRSAFQFYKWTIENKISLDSGVDGSFSR